MVIMMEEDEDCYFYDIDVDVDGHLKWYHCGVHEVVQPGGEVLVQSHREDQVPGSQDCNLILLLTHNLDRDVMFRPFMP